MVNLTSAQAAIAAKIPSALIERHKLALAVALATLPVERRNTIPILSNLSVIGDGAGLAFEGTDLDVVVRARANGPADSDLAATIPADRLSDLLKKAKASDMAALEISTDSDGAPRAKVDLGGVTYALNGCLPIADYPESKKPAKATWAINAADFMAALDRCRMAVSTEETRYYLNGIYWHSVKTGKTRVWRAVATDGHRMVTFDLPYTGNHGSEPATIIPRKAIETLFKAMALLKKAKAAPEIITVNYDGGGNAPAMSFDLGACEIVTKTIDGTFPDYSRVIPLSNENMARLDVAAFGEAVEQVSLISAEKSRAVRLEFAPGKLGMACHSPDNGSAETSLGIEYKGAPVIAGFNGHYLREMLADMAGGEFVMCLRDGGAPALIRDPGEPRFCGVLMPMRVQ